MLWIEMDDCHHPSYFREERNCNVHTGNGERRRASHSCLILLRMEEAASLQISGLCLSARIARHELFSVVVDSAVMVVVVAFVFDDFVDVIFVVCYFCGL